MIYFEFLIPTSNDPNLYLFVCWPGSIVKEPGEPVEGGLSPDVALELGLEAGTPVGTSIIDAHAGGLGLVGCQSAEVRGEISSRICKYPLTTSSQNTWTITNLVFVL